MPFSLGFMPDMPACFLLCFLLKTHFGPTSFAYHVNSMIISLFIKGGLLLFGDLPFVFLIVCRKFRL